MDFATLRKGAGFDLPKVAIMLHQPSVAGQRAALLALVADHPALFERYQDNHPKSAEATLKRRSFAASFVVDVHGEARFVGMYAIKGWTFRDFAQLQADPQRQALAALIEGEGGSADPAAEGAGQGRAVFDLEPLEALAGLNGRLVVRRPAGQAYMRLAENCPLPLFRIEETAQYVPPLPEWDALVLTAAQIKALPKSWGERMTQWRGIYLIVDARDGARYVGSAYGAENILGRWRAHVAGDKGVTVELGKRDPALFRFSILELLSPTASVGEVVLREGSWKERLGTRLWGLNKN